MITSHKFSKRGIIKLLAITVFIITSLFYLYTYGLVELKEIVEESQQYASHALFTLRFTSILIPALPSTAYSLLSGALLGFKKGIVLICLADLSACIICFGLARYFGRDLVKKLVGKKFIEKVETFSKKKIENNFLLMTGLLMTGLFDFVSYGIGLTKTPWKKFLPSLIVSILISDPPIVALGSGILEGGKTILVFSIIGILALSFISNLSKQSNK